MDADWFESNIVGRANLNPVFDRVVQVSPYKELYAELFIAAGNKVAKHTVKSIIRAAFFIQPVTQSVNTAKYAVRWQETPEQFFDFIPHTDSRWCSFDECIAIGARLCEELIAAIQDPIKLEILIACTNNSLIAHDLPLDYEVAPHTNPPTRIHTDANIQWHWDEQSKRTFLLREHIRRIPGQNGTVIKRILENKIQVKTYLTDRAQTGLYQTNREIRWEAHPLSVQFALRRECWAIEHKLVEQIFFLEDFPEALRDSALDLDLIQNLGDITRCPITLKPMLFADISNEMTNPDHGRSNFQVGHLSPLKTVSRLENGAGHTANNISWISADGNRIQGHRSLEETRQMIQEIAARMARLT